MANGLVSASVFFKSTPQSATFIFTFTHSHTRSYRWQRLPAVRGASDTNQVAAPVPDVDQGDGLSVEGERDEHR